MSVFDSIQLIIAGVFYELYTVFKLRNAQNREFSRNSLLYGISHHDFIVNLQNAW